MVFYCSYLLQIFLKLSLSRRLFVDEQATSLPTVTIPFSARTGWKSRLNGLLRFPWVEDRVLNTSVLPCAPSRVARELRVLKLDLRRLRAIQKSALCFEWERLCFARRWSSLQSVWLVPAFFCSLLKEVFTTVFVLTGESLSAVMFCIFSKMRKNCLKKHDKVKNHSLLRGKTWSSSNLRFSLNFNLGGRCTNSLVYGFLTD